MMILISQLLLLLLLYDTDTISLLLLLLLLLGLIIPTVQFDNGVTTAVGPVEFTYRHPSGDGEISRRQVPLKLAW